MKKLFLFASLAAAVFTSCTNEIDGPQAPYAQGKSTIKASYPVGDNADSRTTISGGEYSWSQGDAIGVFNAQADDAVNGLFAYSGTTNEFKGDLDMYKNNSYYVYYPYAPLATVSSENELTLSISPKQNFNFSAMPEEWSWNTTTGSFAAGAAPSVGIGTSSADDQLTVQMEAVAGYVVFAVEGYSVDPITTVTLTVEKDGAVQLSGDLTVDMTTFATDPTEAVTLVEDEANSIELNCGKGLPLSLDTPVNLWFVVPAETPFQGATFTLQFGSDDQNLITKTIDNPAAPETVGANKIRWMTPATNTAFQYTGDYAVITTPLQFLEYANLVTNGNGESFVTDWNGLSSNEREKSSLSTFLKSAAFENESTLNTTIDLATNLKPALVSGTLDLTPSSIEIGTAGTGYFPDKIPAYFSYLSDYTSSSMTAIGGAAAYTISGMEGATLKGLTIAGNGMFTGVASTAIANINGLTFESPVLNATGVDAVSYYMLCQQPKITSNNPPVVFSDVTVTGECEFTGVADDVPTALFNTVSAQYLNSYPTAVTNETEPAVAYANNLNVNQNLNFNNFVEANITPQTFNNINTILKSGNVVTVIEPADAIYVIEAVSKNANKLPYSVVDATTSYWTGTVYEPNTTAPFTAEELAYVVQSNTATSPVELDIDLNLMGSNGAFWWATSSQSNVVTITNPNKNVISEIYINGTDGETQMTTYLTVLGRASTVTGLILEDITIENTGDDAISGATIAAVSGYPAAASTVTVNGLTVNASTAANEAVGGLYGNLTQSSIGRVGTSTITDCGNEDTSVSQGLIAANLDYTISGVTASLTNPLTSGEGQPFGSMTITVNPASTSGSSTLNVTGFTDEFVKSLKPQAAAGTNNGYTFNVVLDGTKYQWQYNSSTEEYVYQGTVVND